ncbi:MAG: SDR family NAD(P)-dependent oxidoreductase [Chitinophagales bacterium]
MNYALITGASKGIGKAIAEELACRKCHLILVSRSEELLRAESMRLEKDHQIKVDFFAIDLSQPGSSKKLFDWCHEKNYTVSILVNNAGYGLSGPFEKYTGDDYLNMMQVNIAVPVELTRLFLPMLKQQAEAHILNVASTAAYQAVPLLTVYSASKSFVLAFSRGLSQELKGTPVSVTCVSPGGTDTEFVVRAQIGKKGLEMAKKLNMSAEAVAKIAVDSMFAGRTETVTGFLNKLGVFSSWLLPKGLVERTAMKIYK